MRERARGRQQIVVDNIKNIIKEGNHILIGERRIFDDGMLDQCHIGYFASEKPGFNEDASIN